MRMLHYGDTTPVPEPEGCYDWAAANHLPQTVYGAPMKQMEGKGLYFIYSILGQTN